MAKNESKNFREQLEAWRTIRIGEAINWFETRMREIRHHQLKTLQEISKRHAQQKTAAIRRKISAD